MDPNFDPSKENVKDIFLKVASRVLKANKIIYDTFDTTVYDLNSIKTAFKHL